MRAVTVRIAVLGAGSWGTALAMQLARVGHSVQLWARDAAHVEAMRASRENSRYLPGAPLADAITPLDDLDQALQGADRILLAVPSSAFAGVLDQIAGRLDAGRGLAWATKGFEPGAGRLLSEAARERLGGSIPLAAVTGPSFAGEVAQGLPTAVTVGASEPEFGRSWAALLHGSSFRAYYTADLVGVQLGGAVKNVLAIACGMADGLGLGNNTRAALITRGLAELMRLGQAMGADARTLMGLAGLGDLVLTCTGEASRNRRFGLALGRGNTPAKAMQAIGQVVEGYHAAEEVMRAAERAGVEMPISEQVHGILFHGWSAAKGVKVLMEREQKAETE
ncbi:MAG: NAD(P)-dependent glycerol-3-phosphate dehydrogenase [Wenzhouxiangellaceae bacterium]|nr:NAD(P)-dependent glycerol-3-phosphate dehydrogenase [Wenzhouxiangellaceae bacterium]MBS3822597.1 NAD(P)-dependent glycerol-3-phosphate dehydrogenase [Wenzhouxiangellaceae bacterium]